MLKHGHPLNLFEGLFMFRYLLHGAPKLDTQSDRLVFKHDPAVIGYFGVYFEGIRNLDERIFGNEWNTYIIDGSDIRNPRIVEESLTAYCSGAEIPELLLKIINQETVQYFSIKIPSTIEYGDQTCNFRFFDTTTGILIRFFRNWFFCLRRADPNQPAKYTTVRYHTGALKCNAIAFCTDPTFTEVTFACGFIGLMPINLPLNAFTMDVENRTFIVFNQRFAYDRIVIDDHLYNFVKDTIIPLYLQHDEVVQWPL